MAARAHNVRELAEGGFSERVLDGDGMLVLRPPISARRGGRPGGSAGAAARGSGEAGHCWVPWRAGAARGNRRHPSPEREECRWEREGGEEKMENKKERWRVVCDCRWATLRKSSAPAPGTPSCPPRGWVWSGYAGGIFCLIRRKTTS